MATREITLIEGRGLPLPGHDIDTDRIMPARFLKAVSFEGLEAHVFEDDRVNARAHGRVHPFDEARFQGATVLVVNRNFGCGSSREHAPQGLRRWGILAVVGESFSEIFFGNALVLGMPCLCIEPAQADRLIDVLQKDSAAKVSVDVGAATVTCQGRTIQAAIPRSAQEALVTGAWDGTGLLLDDAEGVQAVAARLPYVTGF
jgi:3-isopropylmalate/(R)-2-methylmalate dehydratase small subunit